MRVFLKSLEVCHLQSTCTQVENFSELLFWADNKGSFIPQKEEVESYLIKYAKPIKIPFVLRN